MDLSAARSFAKKKLDTRILQDWNIIWEVQPLRSSIVSLGIPQERLAHQKCLEFKDEILYRS